MTAVEDLLFEWQDRLIKGMPVSPEELCAEHPELLGELRWQIQALQMVESHFGIAEENHMPSDDSDGFQHESTPPREIQLTTNLILESLHARGGLGKIFVASDPILNRRVAIKFPRFNSLTSNDRARFAREAMITGKLSHPGIVPVHAFQSSTDGSLCYTMRFVSGPTLHSAIENLHRPGSSLETTHARTEVETVPAGSGTLWQTNEAPLPANFTIQELLRRLVSVCQIVAYAHGQGVVHRDIKPANILLGEFGETLLLDWGLAKVIDSPDPLEPEFAKRELEDLCELGADHVPDSVHTFSGQIMGTLGFASPEQLRGDQSSVGFASDIFSLGATLFAILTGISPRSGARTLISTTEQASETSFGPRDLNSSVALALDAICRKALALQPADRYPSVWALGQDLERFLNDEPILARSEPLKTRAGRWMRKHPRTVGSLAAATLVGLFAAMIGWFWIGQKNEQLSTANSLLGMANGRLQKQNQDLSQAINEVAQTNQSARKALRTLVDEIVMQQFQQEPALSASQRAYLEEVLCRYEELAAIQGETTDSREIRAEGFLQCGKILLRLGQHAQALDKLNRAETLYEGLVEQVGGFEYRTWLVQTLCTASEVLRNQSAFAESIKRVERAEAVSLTAPTAEPTPDFSRFELLTQRARVEFDAAHFVQASNYYQRARDFAKQLVDQQPDSLLFQKSFASSLVSNADLHWRLGRRQEALRESNLAVAANRDLVALLPDDPERHLQLARSLNVQAFQASGVGDKVAAISACTESMAVTSRLSAKFPNTTRYRTVFLAAQSIRGAAYQDTKNLEAAEEDFRNSHEAARTLLESEPDNPIGSNLYLEAMRKLANVYLLRQNLPAAETVYLESDRYGQRQDGQALSNSQLMTWAQTRLDYSSFLRQQKRFDPAKSVLIATIPVFETLAKSVGGVYPNLNLAQAHTRLGLTWIGLQNAEQASAALERASRQSAQLITAHPDNPLLLNPLVDELNLISRGWEDLGELDQAAKQRETETTLRERLNQLFPNQVYLEIQLANSWTDFAEFRLRHSQSDEAKNCLRRAENVLTKAAQRDPNHSTLPKLLEQCRQKLENINPEMN